MIHVIICEPVDFPQELSKYIIADLAGHMRVELLAVCRLENGVAHYVRIR